ncbi:hypothetical protein ACE6H2_022317 [Prunus campanulata]
MEHLKYFENMFTVHTMFFGLFGSRLDVYVDLLQLSDNVKAVSDCCTLVSFFNIFGSPP